MAKVASKVDEAGVACTALQCQVHMSNQVTCVCSSTGVKEHTGTRSHILQEGPGSHAAPAQSQAARMVHPPGFDTFSFIKEHPGSATPVRQGGHLARSSPHAEPPSAPPRGQDRCALWAGLCVRRDLGLHGRVRGLRDAHLVRRCGPRYKGVAGRVVCRYRLPDVHTAPPCSEGHICCFNGEQRRMA